jgi:hypothetical protein
MRSRNFACYILPIILTMPVIAQQGQNNGDQWKAVDAGQLQPGEVCKFAMPRKDLKVTKAGITIAPGLPSVPGPGNRE